MRPRIGAVGGAGIDVRAEELHHRATVGLLVIAHLTMYTSQGDIEKVAGKGQGRAPLPRARLGGDLVDTLDLVVIGLGTAVLGLWLPTGLTPSYL